MMIKIYAAILCGASLAACSSSSGSDASGVVAGQPGSQSESAATAQGAAGNTTATRPLTSRSLTASSALTGGVVSADYNATTGAFTVTALGGSTVLNRFPIADRGAMLAMRDAAGLHNAYYGEGTGTQIVVYSGGSAGNVAHYAAFGRVGATELPLTGTGQFRGDYVGFTSTRRINGTAVLDVDFAKSTIGGAITNREFRQRPDNGFDAVSTLGTLRLDTAALGPDGSFSGATGGGQIIRGQQLWNPASGSYAGLIGGADAREVVGTVAVTHRAATGGQFDEVGGFLATR